MAKVFSALFSFLDTSLFSLKKKKNPFQITKKSNTKAESFLGGGGGNLFSFFRFIEFCSSPSQKESDYRKLCSQEYLFVKIHLYI